jgi:NAD(P)-dependent dehydrogenase (short-subunit alcohol dehydrogenase family)
VLFCRCQAGSGGRKQREEQAVKIIVIGGTGTIGRHVAKRLEQDHEVIVAGRRSGQVQVDIGDPDSIKRLYEATGKVDAVACIAGEAKWAAFESMSESDFQVGIQSKLMGQVNLVRAGIPHMNPGGSFTLTTGILADDPVVGSSSPAMVNGAIHSFVRAVTLELRDGRRINAVSAALVEESLDAYGSFFPGHNTVPMHKVVNAYVKSIEGRATGKIITVYDNR